MDEHVLGAVVAMHQRQPRGRACRRCSVGQERRGLRDLRGGVGVVGLQAQRFEKASGRRRRPAALPVARRRCGGSCRAVARTGATWSGLSAPASSIVFQLSCGRGTACHGEQVLVAILEDQRRGRAGRRERGSQRSAEGFALDPRRAAEPVHRDAQFRQRLLHHPVLAAGALDQHRPVGDAAAKRLDGDATRRARAGRWRAGRRAEPRVARYRVSPPPPSARSRAVVRLLEHGRIDDVGRQFAAQHGGSLLGGLALQSAIAASE